MYNNLSCAIARVCPSVLSMLACADDGIHVAAAAALCRRVRVSQRWSARSWRRVVCRVCFAALNPQCSSKVRLMLCRGIRLLPLLSKVDSVAPMAAARNWWRRIQLVGDAWRQRRSSGRSRVQGHGHASDAHAHTYASTCSRVHCAGCSL